MKTIAEKALNIVKDTAKYVKLARTELQQHQISYKMDSSLVTAIDIGSEERLVDGLGKLLPDATFLAEENYKNEDLSDLMWIIDPIDGTTNFVHGFPMYCISVGLAREGKIVLGIIYEISSGECFWSHEAIDGAYLNDTPIRVSPTASVRESVLATGFPPFQFEKMDAYFDHFKSFMMKTHGIRRLGSAAMDLAYVAAGRCDGFFEYNLNPWDVAAGSYLVEKAGGRVTDFSGGDNYLHGKEILASNQRIHAEFLSEFIDKIP